MRNGVLMRDHLVLHLRKHDLALAQFVLNATTNQHHQASSRHGYLDNGNIATKALRPLRVGHVVKEIERMKLRMNLTTQHVAGSEFNCATSSGGVNTEIMNELRAMRGTNAGSANVLD